MKVLFLLTLMSQNGRAFRNNKTNEAFIDRVNIIKVPYCTRLSEEVKIYIYRKLLEHSSLQGCTLCARHPENSGSVYNCYPVCKEPEQFFDVFSKMRIYDGENLKDTDPQCQVAARVQRFSGCRRRYGWPLNPVCLQNSIQGF